MTSSVREALSKASRFGGIEGEHQKQWVIDQTVRELAGPHYAAWVRACNFGYAGPETCHWDVGIAP